MRIACLAAITACAFACSDSSGSNPCNPDGTPIWLSSARILVPGVGVANQDCRTGVCKHNENTDLVRYQGAIYLVHRTALSQALGPNSSLRFLRSDDEGTNFTLVATFPAVNDRDIRDPHFYQVGDELHVKAITRIPGFTARDQGRQTISIGLKTTDGADYQLVGDLGPQDWGFWRVAAHEGAFYSAAYEDGDLSVVLYSSTDGVAWTPGATIYDVAADTPLETELIFVPSGKMLALVRLDGTDTELLGDSGRLRTKVCWAEPPYSSFDCSRELTGVRLDGPAHFTAGSRLFVIARKHLQPSQRKRTTLYEITGDLDGGDVSAVEMGELPSAGDTSYTGVVELADGRFLVSWYSGDVGRDEAWSSGLFTGSDIWVATIDPDKIPADPPAEFCSPSGANVGDAGPEGGEFDACQPGEPNPDRFCGQPCDMGNDLGVGEYCTTDTGECGDNTGPATICSDILNGSLAVESSFCTFLCMPGLTDCGQDAYCGCLPLNTGDDICGCVPDRCPLPPTGDAGPAAAHIY